MAKTKYFHILNTANGAEHVAQAPRASAALAAVAGDPKAIKPATDEQIAEHFANGGTLHEKSLEQGQGKLFYIANEPPVLVRAKNSTDAFSLVSNGAFEVKPASQDDLVRLLSAGVKVVKYEEPAKRAASQTGDGGGTGAAGNTDGQDQADSASSEGSSATAAGSSVEGEPTGTNTASSSDNAPESAPAPEARNAAADAVDATDSASGADAGNDEEAAHDSQTDANAQAA